MSTTPIETHGESALVPRPAPRAYALDALRGISILMMVLSGLVPSGLPGWMYHAQDAPPSHETNILLPGITWVDLVFPFFLFSMGAAIPLALTRRLEKGAPIWKILAGVLQRGALLVFFAIYVRHTSPWLMNPAPGKITAAFALLGFVLVFPVLARLPARWKPANLYLVRALGWVAIAFYLVALSSRGYVDGATFSTRRADVIILVLANMAVGGSVMWLATRNSLLARLACIGAMFALRMSSTVPGWAKSVWNWAPESISWFYRMEYWKYLMVVIPGTIAGDRLLAWMRSVREEGPASSWSRTQLLALMGTLLAVLGVLLVGLYGPRPVDPMILASGQFARWTVPATVISAILCLLALALVRKPVTASDRLLAFCVSWGSAWLALGLILEPFEGGIKKSNTTFSYFFVTAGLALFLLAAFVILIDVLRREGWFGLLIANGQNPMIAYIGWANLVFPVLAITGAGELIQAATNTPTLGLFRALLITLTLAVLVALFSRKQIVLRT